MLAGSGSQRVREHHEPGWTTIKQRSAPGYLLLFVSTQHKWQLNATPLMMLMHAMVLLLIERDVILLAQTPCQQAFLHVHVLHAAVCLQERLSPQQHRSWRHQQTATA